MLQEYKELCRLSAETIPGWKELSKNDLCRAYVANKDNPVAQNAYLSAILYRYWNLISKYYYLSSNCATPEDCYEWLVDSVSCCVSLASWENPESSIYNDPNGPDKVINRCMKCARLTYYQFINRKKRRDNFGLLSIEEMKELFGSNISEPSDPKTEADFSSFVVKEYIISLFYKKDYFVSFLLDTILNTDVFNVTKDQNDKTSSELNIRRLVKVMTTLDEAYLTLFSLNYDIAKEDVDRAATYVRAISVGTMKKKILQTIENLKHSSMIKVLRGNIDVD